MRQKKVVKTQSTSQRKLSTEILRFYIFNYLQKLKKKKEVNDRNIMLVPYTLQARSLS